MSMTEFTEGMIFLHVSQRRKLAAEVIRTYPDWSNRRLARESHLSRDLVNKTRAELIARGEIPKSKRLGMDNKRYAVRTKTA